MSQVSEYHQYLFLGKITNTLTEEEEEQLRDLFAHDEQAKQAYNTLLDALPEKEVAESFRHLNEPGFWKNVPATIRAERAYNRRRRILQISAAVAIIALAGAGGYFFYKGAGRAHSTAAIAIQQTGGVELKLASGKTIDLSASKGNLQQDNWKITNDSNALRYELGAAEPGGMNTVTVPVAKDYKINLNDGSEIWLNSATVLTFPSRFAGNTREISIEGEAYLKIAPNATRPFIVHLPGNTVQVTGTELNVNTYTPEEIRVSLVNGGVNVRAGNAYISLKPGQQGLSSGGLLTADIFDESKVLSWRKGLFYFEKANLQELSLVLARWFGVKTIIDDPSLSNKRFAGVLDKNRPLDSFLDNLDAISRIKSYYDKAGVLHFK